MRSSSSWDKPERAPDFIARKRSDWSLFRRGTHIPLEFLPDFEKANGNYRLKRGEAREVILLYQDRFFQATICNIDRPTKSETVQIRFDGNNELKALLREELKKSFNHLEQKGPHTRVPVNLHPDSRSKFTSTFPQAYTFPLECVGVIREPEMFDRSDHPSFRGVGLVRCSISQRR